MCSEKISLNKNLLGNNRRTDGLAVFLLQRVPDVQNGKNIMNSKIDGGSPTQPPKPRKGYYKGKELIGLFRPEPGETKTQLAKRVYQAMSEALAKDANWQSSALRSRRDQICSANR